MRRYDDCPRYRKEILDPLFDLPDFSYSAYNKAFELMNEKEDRLGMNLFAEKPKIYCEMFRDRYITLKKLEDGVDINAEWQETVRKLKEFITQHPA